MVSRVLVRIDARRGPEAPLLDEVLCGLSLLGRAIRVAQARGASRIAVWILPEDGPVAQRVIADASPSIPVAVVTTNDLGSDELPTLTLSYDCVADVVLRNNHDRNEAKRRLFDACRKPVDGLVSRHLNRHISIAISKLVVDWPISPNAMTAFTFSLSLVAAWFAVQGGYWPTLAAAFLMQWNSILDGCDGELARVRHQGSRLGQWLDTIGDDWSNVIFWASLGMGARSIPGIGGALAACGAVGAAGNATAALANYAVLARIGSGDFYALDAGKPADRSGVAGAILGAIELVLKQDFFLFLMLLVAAAGWMHHALVVIAVGALVTAANSIVRAVRFFAGRRARATG